MATKLKKEGYVVIAVAVIAMGLVIAYLFNNVGTDTTTAANADKVVLSENGEASYLNLSVPSTQQKEDKMSLIEKMDKIKNDSINKSKISTTGLETVSNEAPAYDPAQSTPAADIYQNSHIPDNPQSDVSLPASSKRSNRSYSSNSYSSGGGSASYTPRKRKASYDYSDGSASTPTEGKEKKTAPKQSKFEGSGNFFDNSPAPSNNNQSQSNETDESIYACIHTDQTIRDGSRVKIRLIKNAMINGNSYPMNTIVYGICRIVPNRLNVEINNVNQNPCKLSIYDAEDSDLGIYIETPNLNASLKGEMGKETLDDTDLKMIPFSKTLKNLFQRKVKEEKIQLLNNYKLIIRLKNDK